MNDTNYRHHDYGRIGTDYVCSRCGHVAPKADPCSCGCTYEEHRLTRGFLLTCKHTELGPHMDEPRVLPDSEVVCS